MADKIRESSEPLKRLELITFTNQRKDRVALEDAGTDEIDTYINTAQIILLLVSADFIASDYCYKAEMQRALERQKQREAHVVPVILRPVQWEETHFSMLQALPQDKPVTLWQNVDEAFLQVAIGIREVIEEVRKLLPDETTMHYDCEQAVLQLEQGLEHHSSDVRLYKYLADVLRNCGQYEKALQAVDQALRFAPHEEAIWCSKGYILRDLRRNNAARLAFEQAIQLKCRDAHAWHIYANILHDLKHNKEALIALEQAIQLAPSDA